jgi:hypothetical protein
MSDIYTWERQSTFKRNKPNASSDRTVQKGYDRKNSDVKKKKKILIVSVTNLDAKMNWLELNRQS